ncbi:bud neck involved protein [Dimargaris cristalligena]|uniref:Uncharacterized protein n=1 Tax=Dimargaris cristalligena TaxID=215637 RepID=A0A4Q0A0K4_9FUNG|nr:bud neck involved protein [Dimargaris cristalligena]RKP39524.1 hypothetical protein BJ085DRAFT_38256 [Dimargaris cristalligena]|eukprot:RKP39524.1 hypothetical protein BJ085DRAFT_38256 [Dimargaris cristalligena]
MDSERPLTPRPRTLAKSSSLSSINGSNFSWRGLLRLKNRRQDDSEPSTPPSLESVPESPMDNSSFGDMKHAINRRTTFTKRVRRVFSSSAIAKPAPMDDPQPYPVLEFSTKPITRIHSTPDQRVLAAYAQSPSPTVATARSPTPSAIFSSEGQHIQAQLDLSQAAPVSPPASSVPSVSSLSPLPPLISPTLPSPVNNHPPHTLAKAGAGLGLNESSGGGGLRTPPVIHQPGPRRMFRKPLLNFQKDSFGLPPEMTNMSLPTPPPRSYAKESRFELNIDPSFLMHSGAGSPVRAFDHHYHSSRPSSTASADSGLEGPTGRLARALPSPVSSPIPLPASAQPRLSANQKSTLSPPAAMRDFLSTPPSSPADQAVVHRGHPSTSYAGEHQSSPLIRHSTLPEDLHPTHPRSPLGNSTTGSSLGPKQAHNPTSPMPETDLTPPPSPPHAPTAVSPNDSGPIGFTNPARFSFTSSDNADLSLDSDQSTMALATPVFPEDTIEMLDPPVTSTTTIGDGIYINPLLTINGSPSSSSSSLSSTSHSSTVAPGPLLPPSILKSCSAYDPISESSSLSSGSFASASSHPQRKRSLKFAETVLIYETFDPTLYDRRGEAMMRLTPEIAFQIKSELNHFKMYELEVHEDSKQYTHFIP